MVARQRGQRQRRPPAPPGLRDRGDDDRRHARLRRPRRESLRGDLRLLLRRRRRPDDRRVRPLGLPRRRLLGAGGTELDRRHGDRRGGDGPGRARRQPVRHRQRIGRPAGPDRLRLCWSRDGGDLLPQGPQPARHHRLLHLPAGALRGLPDRQTGLGLGAAALRRAPAEEAGEVRRALPADRRTDRLKDAFRDIVGGKPSEGLDSVRDEAIAATKEATEEVRQRAEQVAHVGEHKHDED